MGFVFTNFQTDNYGTSSGDDEGICTMYTHLYNVHAIPPIVTWRSAVVIGWKIGEYKFHYPEVAQTSLSFWYMLLNLISVTALKKSPINSKRDISISVHSTVGTC